MQILYGLGGERRLTEIELPELEGYRGSRPVRVGNEAYRQFQLDIYGELLDSAHLYRKFGGEIDADYWRYLCEVVEFALSNWREPDDGIWETRSGRQHFVHSKVMCWVAVDRAIKAAEALGFARGHRALEAGANGDQARCACEWATMPNAARSSRLTAARCWTQAI